MLVLLKKRKKRPKSKGYEGLVFFQYLKTIMAGFIFCLVVSVRAEGPEITSKIWAWTDSLQIQLIDKAQKASFIVFVKYDSEKRFITSYEMDFVTLNNQPVPQIFKQFENYENLKRLPQYIDEDLIESFNIFQPYIPAHHSRIPQISDYVFLRLPSNHWGHKYIMDQNVSQEQKHLILLGYLLERIFSNDHSIKTPAVKNSCDNYLIEL